jgi:hypothetical protein
MAMPKNAVTTTGTSTGSSNGEIVIQTESDWSSPGKPSVTIYRGSLIEAALFKTAKIANPSNIIVEVYDYSTGVFVKKVQSKKTSFTIDNLGEKKAYTLKIRFDSNDTSGAKWTWRISSMKKCFIIGINGSPIKY